MEIKEIKKRLEKSKNTDIQDFDPNSIPDISEIKIDMKENVEERKKNFLNTYISPYFFKVNGRIVKVEFSENNITAEECFHRAFEDMVLNNS